MKRSNESTVAAEPNVRTVVKSTNSSAPLEPTASSAPLVQRLTVWVDMGGDLLDGDQPNPSSGGLQILAESG